VVAGGREGFRWEMYPGHQYLHVTGLLNCAGLNGCWKSKLSECKNKKDHLPMCYFMIPSNEVVKAVLKYYCAFPRNGV